MAIERELLDQLLAGRNPDEVFAKDGLHDDLKKALSARILNAELDKHVDDERAEGGDNRRNGHSKKTVLTGTSKMTLSIPRDRGGTFDPKLIVKYQCRFSDFDEKTISMYGRDMTVCEIRGHLEELYGTDVSPDLASTITDAVLESERLLVLMHRAIDDVPVRSVVDICFHRISVDGGIDDVPYIIGGAKDERPVHECLHVAVGHDLIAEIGEEELAAGLDKLHCPLQQPNADSARKVVIKTRSVDEIERAETIGAAKNTADGTVPRLDHGSGQVTVHNGNADGILVQPDPALQPSPGKSLGTLRFAQVAARYRQNLGLLDTAGRLVDAPRQYIPSFAPGHRTWSLAGIGIDIPPERGRRSQYPRRARMLVINIQQTGVAGIAARLLEGPAREWILQ